MKPTIIVSALAGILALSACGSTPIEEAVEAAEPAKEVESDESISDEAQEFLQTEFGEWMMDNYVPISEVLNDAAEVSDYMDSGDYMDAADAAVAVGEDFTDLYMEAPEDGTPLSDAINEMLLTCGAAFTDSGEALHDMDGDAMEDVVSDLDDCSSDMDAFTAALSVATESLD